MRVLLVRQCLHLVEGQEYEVLALQGNSYWLLANDVTPRLFASGNFEITDAHHPSFWISCIRENNESYTGPKVWTHSEFSADASFWQDLYRLYPWTVEHHPDLPLPTRYTIFVDHVDDATDFLLIQDWLKRWEGKVKVADYSTGGWEHIWDVEAPPEAVAELPEEFLCSSEWSDSAPFRRIQ